VQEREVTVQPSAVGWILVLYQLVLGFVTMALAVDEGFAEGKVAFQAEPWRVAFGVAGLYLFYRAARGVLRMVNRATVEITPEQHRNSRRHGIVHQLIGAGFLLVIWVGELGERSIEFESWARPFYIAAGIFLVWMGTLHWINPQAAVRYQQAMKTLERLRKEQSDS
jgi:hypothetical protein